MDLECPVVAEFDKRAVCGAINNPDVELGGNRVGQLLTIRPDTSMTLAEV
jgi:hypothetical protein